ncbi:hypothetical protein CHS0354_037526 [Potamilus streckersoni]|uniref:C2H2-type domain-containing protein n=1 Tax=Potamilus streckersoni TaxID=2493646 RepID=A0AAE0VGW4_9BIVA|nr:hypothetical protein CHS0354_037526 [Potamilus streckersoni]
MLILHNLLWKFCIIYCVEMDPDFNNANPGLCPIGALKITLPVRQLQLFIDMWKHSQLDANKINVSYDVNVRLKRNFHNPEIGCERKSFQTFVSDSIWTICMENDQICFSVSKLAPKTGPYQHVECTIAEVVKFRFNDSCVIQKKTLNEKDLSSLFSKDAQMEVSSEFRKYGTHSVIHYDESHCSGDNGATQDCEGKIQCNNTAHSDGRKIPFKDIFTDGNKKTMPFEDTKSESDTANMDDKEDSFVIDIQDSSGSKSTTPGDNQIDEKHAQTASGFDIDKSDIVMSETRKGQINPAINSKVINKEKSGCKSKNVSSGTLEGSGNSDMGRKKTMAIEMEIIEIDNNEDDNCENKTVDKKDKDEEKNEVGRYQDDEVTKDEEEKKEKECYEEVKGNHEWEEVEKEEKLAQDSCKEVEGEEELREDESKEVGEEKNSVLSVKSKEVGEEKNSVLSVKSKEVGEEKNSVLSVKHKCAHTSLTNPVVGGSNSNSDRVPEKKGTASMTSPDKLPLEECFEEEFECDVWNDDLMNVVMMDIVTEATKNKTKDDFEAEGKGLKSRPQIQDGVEHEHVENEHIISGGKTDATGKSKAHSCSGRTYDDEIFNQVSQNQTDVAKLQSGCNHDQIRIGHEKLEKGDSPISHDFPCQNDGNDTEWIKIEINPDFRENAVESVHDGAPNQERNSRSQNSFLEKEKCDCPLVDLSIVKAEPVDDNESTDARSGSKSTIENFKFQGISPQPLRAQTSQSICPPLLTAQTSRCISTPQTAQTSQVISTSPLTAQTSHGINSSPKTAQTAQGISTPLLTAHASQCISTPLLTAQTFQSISAPQPTAQTSQGISTPRLTAQTSQGISTPGLRAQTVTKTSYKLPTILQRRNVPMKVVPIVTSAPTEGLQISPVMYQCIPISSLILNQPQTSKKGPNPSNPPVHKNLQMSFSAEESIKSSFSYEPLKINSSSRLQLRTPAHLGVAKDSAIASVQNSQMISRLTNLHLVQSSHPLDKTSHPLDKSTSNLYTSMKPIDAATVAAAGSKANEPCSADMPTSVSMPTSISMPTSVSMPTLVCMPKSVSRPDIHSIRRCSSSFMIMKKTPYQDEEQKINSEIDVEIVWDNLSLTSDQSKTLDPVRTSGMQGEASHGKDISSSSDGKSQKGNFVDEKTALPSDRFDRLCKRMPFNQKICDLEKESCDNKSCSSIRLTLVNNTSLEAFGPNPYQGTKGKSDRKRPPSERPLAGINISKMECFRSKKRRTMFTGTITSFGRIMEKLADRDLDYQIHDSNRLVECINCKEVFISEQDFFYHMVDFEIYINKSSCRCKCCKLRFTNHELLDSHFQLHSVFKNKNGAEINLKREYECKHCEELFCTHRLKLEHDLMDHSLGQVHANLCSECNRAFPNRIWLHMHYKQCCPSQQEQLPLLSFRCQYCGSEFSEKGHCNDHEESCMKASIHHCPYCGIAMGKLLSMAFHISFVHYGVKMICCTENNCSLQFESPLRQMCHRIVDHQAPYVVHQLEESQPLFRCQLCRKSIYSVFELYDHLSARCRWPHGKWVNCKICELKFLSQKAVACHTCCVHPVEEL